MRQSKQAANKLPNEIKSTNHGQTLFETWVGYSQHSMMENSVYWPSVDRTGLSPRPLGHATPLLNPGEPKSGIESKDQDAYDPGLSVGRNEKPKSPPTIGRHPAKMLHESYRHCDVGPDVRPV